MVVGFALFGALTYLPLFQQIVRGLSPDRVGPAAAAGDGRAADLVDRLGAGHHAHRALQGRSRSPARRSPRSACGCSRRWTRRRRRASPRSTCSCSGSGLGMVMQVLVLAVQNAVPYDMLGVATSGSTLFRSIGGSLGTAVLGAIFSGRLAAELPAPAAPERERLDPSAIERLPAAVHDAYIAAFTDALHVGLPRRRRSSWRSRSCCRGSSRSGRCARRSSDRRRRGARRPGRHRLAARAHARAEPRRRAASGRWRSWPRRSRAPASTSPPAPRGRCCASARPTPPGRRARRAAARRRRRAWRRAVDELRAGGLLDGERPDRRGPRDARAPGRRPHRRPAELVADWEPDENPELDPLLRRLADELAAPA